MVVVVVEVVVSVLRLLDELSSWQDRSEAKDGAINDRDGLIRTNRAATKAKDHFIVVNASKYRPFEF